MVFEIDQLQDLFKYSKDAGFADTVFAVLVEFLPDTKNFGAMLKLTCKLIEMPEK